MRDHLLETAADEEDRSVRRQRMDEKPPAIKTDEDSISARVASFYKPFIPVKYTELDGYK